jgi:hypothetical protein
MASRQRAFFVGGRRRLRDATSNSQLAINRARCARPVFLANTPRRRSASRIPLTTRSQRPHSCVATISRASQQEVRMFDPNQPRIPKHHPGGGRWTRGGYGMLSDVNMLAPLRDGGDGSARPTLADLPHYAWVRDINERPQPIYDFSWSGRQPLRSILLRQPRRQLPAGACLTGYAAASVPKRRAAGTNTSGCRNRTVRIATRPLPSRWVAINVALRIGSYSTEWSGSRVMRS